MSLPATPEDIEEARQQGAHIVCDVNDEGEVEIVARAPKIPDSPVKISFLLEEDPRGPGELPNDAKPHSL